MMKKLVIGLNFIFAGLLLSRPGSALESGTQTYVDLMTYQPTVSEKIAGLFWPYGRFLVRTDATRGDYIRFYLKLEKPNTRLRVFTTKTDIQVSPKEIDVSSGFYQFILFLDSLEDSTIHFEATLDGNILTEEPQLKLEKNQVKVSDNTIASENSYRDLVLWFGGGVAFSSEAYGNLQATSTQGSLTLPKIKVEADWRRGANLWSPGMRQGLFAEAAYNPV